MSYEPKKRFTPSTPQPNLTKPLVHGLDAIKGARDLISKFGSQVEPALHALLCDTKSPARDKVDKALKGDTQSAVGMLVPLLIAQFSLAPAVATVVAAVAVQAIAIAGKEKLCEALAEAPAAPPPPTQPAPPPLLPLATKKVSPPALKTRAKGKLKTTPVAKKKSTKTKRAAKK